MSAITAHIDAPPSTRNFSALLAMLLVVYCTFYSVLRQFNELPLLAVSVLATVSALYYQAIYPPRQLQFMLLIATAGLVFSLQGIMPNAWTIYRDNSAAVRHFFPYIAIPIFIVCFGSLWRQLYDFVCTNALPIALALFVLTRLSSLAAGRDMSQDLLLYAVSNANLPIVICLAIWVSTSRSILSGAFRSVPFLLASTSSTNLIISLCVLSLRILPRKHFIVPLALLVSTSVGMLYAISAPAQIWSVDANAGVRAIMWRDALASTVQTNGLGVGFGTEYITNQFSDLLADWTLRSEYDVDRLFVSTHSGFFDVLLRLGIVGAALFVSLLLRGALPIQFLSREDARIFYSMTCILVASVQFNPGFVSVEIFIGIALVIALQEFLIRFRRNEQASSGL
jgi:hypothetical protein